MSDLIREIEEIVDGHLNTSNPIQDSVKTLITIKELIERNDESRQVIAREVVRSGKTYVCSESVFNLDFHLHNGSDLGLEVVVTAIFEPEGETIDIINKIATAGLDEGLRDILLDMVKEGRS